MRRSKLVINCLPGLSPFLKQEVEDLGYRPLKVERNGVTVEGGWKETIHLNLNLRTGSRVLWLIRSFEASNPHQLYLEAKKTPWHKLIPSDGFISIQSFVKNDHIADTRFANLKLKDAIVDEISEKTGKRPNSGKERDRTVIFLYWFLNQVHIYFDTSGETISKHGYRKNPFKAPMMESLAAACLISAQWNDKRGSFINPMCGSGTLAIEAAMMAAGIPPGMHRSNYGFMHINGYDHQTYQEQKSAIEFRDKINSTIIATDHDAQAIKATRDNARNAGVDGMIQFDKVPFERTFIPRGPGLVMLNPEYGERLGDVDALKKVYTSIGDFFKHQCQGKTGYIFTGNSELSKNVGLRTKSRTPFQNARIECRLLEYELYEGRRSKG